MMQRDSPLRKGWLTSAAASRGTKEAMTNRERDMAVSLLWFLLQYTALVVALRVERKRKTAQEGCCNDDANHFWFFPFEVPGEGVFTRA